MIIDDQYAVIKEKGNTQLSLIIWILDNLIVSKKFVKMISQLNSKKKQQDLIHFQYPNIDEGQYRMVVVGGDPNLTHFDECIPGKVNQLYGITILISRLFLQSFCLYPD